MKHRPVEAGRIQKASAQISVELDGGPAETIARHLEWVLDQTQTLNLTAIREPAEAVRLHVVDSLLALPEITSEADGRMLDLGTGGGFPGVPLAVASGRTATLIDSVGKKAAALSSFLESEGLSGQIEAKTVRAEDLAREKPADYAIVVARAVAALPSLVELSAPNLREAGILVALKGRLGHEELASGIAAGAECGMEFESERTAELPGGEETRTIVVFRRTGQPKVALPRRTGLAQKRPLG